MNRSDDDAAKRDEAIETLKAVARGERKLSIREIVDLARTVQSAKRS